MWLHDIVRNIGPMSCCRVVVGGLVNVILPTIPIFVGLHEFPGIKE